MKNFIGNGGETAEEIKDLLSANADSCEEMDYTRKLTPDEMLDIKELHSVTAVQLKKVEDQKKEAVDKFKLTLKPLQVLEEELITKLTNKAEFIRNGTVYKFIDLKAQRVGFYNPQGDLVTERPLNAEERQMNIMGNIRTLASGE